MQFVVLSDSNASDFVGRVTMPIFRDPTPGRASWTQMEPGSIKHDTFVFDAQGQRTLVWKASGGLDATKWRTDIAAAVRALPP